jgi:hypothetical protein
VNTSAHAFVFSQQGGVHVITIINKIWLYNKESLFCVILATPLASLDISDCLHVLLMVFFLGCFVLLVVYFNAKVLFTTKKLQA